MAWQKDVGIGRYGSKLRVRVDLLNQNRAANRSAIRVRVYAYNGGRSRTYNVGSGADVAISGTVSKKSSETFDIPGKSWHTFMDQNFTVDHGSDGSLKLSIKGSITNTGTTSLGSGGSATVTATLPRLILAPTTPSWGSTTYVSKSRIEAKWTNNATTRGPYSSLEVQRHNGKAWQSLITLGATGSKVGDTGFPKNSEVRYRVRAKGPGGTSGWVQGGTLGTSPAYPTNVQAVKSGESIRVSWTDQAKATNRTRTFIIEDNPDGDGWTQVGTIGGSATSWTHEDPDPAVTHQYKVAARITSGRDHQSNFSAHSNTVQLQAAPKQPTRQQPQDANTYEVGDELRFEWTHNPVDTTAQTAAELAWRIDGGDWHTEEVGSDDHVSVTPETDETRALLEWRVRTKGDHPDWSPWSTTNGPQLSTRPTVVIQEPEDGSDLDVSRMAVSWGYEPNGDESQLGQSQWRATLSQADADSGELGEVEQKSGDGTADDTQFDARLDNDTTYTVTVEVENGDGLWSEADTATVLTDFPTPVLVDVFPEWDRGEGAVALSFGEAESPTTYAWEGEAFASRSVMTNGQGDERVNLAQNPRFHTLKRQIGEGTGSSGGGATLETVEGRGVSITGDGSTASSAYLMLTATPVGDLAGKTVTVSAEITLDDPVPDPTASSLARRIVLTINGNGGQHVVAESEPAPNEPGTYRLHLTHTLPDASDEWLVRLYNGSTSGTVYWDKVVIEEGETEGAYWDGDSASHTDAEAIDVERCDEGGDWLLIASGIDSGGTIIDRTPRIGDVEYRAIARTTLPTERTGEVAVAQWVHDHDPVWVNGGASMGTVRRARGAEANDEYGVEQTSHQFAGRSRPTPFFGEATTREVSMTGRILHVPDRHEVSTRPEWVELLHQFGVVCYRDCRGRKVFGLLDVSFDTKQTVETVSVKVTETEWEEGVQRMSDLDLEEQLAGGDET